MIAALRRKTKKGFAAVTGVALPASKAAVAAAEALAGKRPAGRGPASRGLAGHGGVRSRIADRNEHARQPDLAPMLSGRMCLLAGLIDAAFLIGVGVSL